MIFYSGLILILAACGMALLSCRAENGASVELSQNETASSIASSEPRSVPVEPVAPRPEREPEGSPADGQRIEISCTSANDSYVEIYIIDEIQKKFFFYNKGTRAIEPACRGDADCNWEYTESKISFENPDNGFVIGQTINRVTGELTSRLAIGDTEFSTRSCEQVAMPTIATNRF